MSNRPAGPGTPDPEGTTPRKPKVKPKPKTAGEGVAEFLLVPKDKPDGTPVIFTPAAIRRLKTDIYLVRRLANVEGLDLTTELDFAPPAATPTETSERIRKTAEPLMAAAEAGFRREVSTTEYTAPDGTHVKTSRAVTELRARAALKDALKSLAALMSGPVNWTGQMSVKFGKRVLAMISKSDEEGPKSEK